MLTFAPSGKQLALWEGRNLSLIDVKDGTTRRQLNVLPSPEAQWQHRGLTSLRTARPWRRWAPLTSSPWSMWRREVRKTFTIRDKGFRLERVAWADNQTLVTQTGCRAIRTRKWKRACCTSGRWTRSSRGKLTPPTTSSRSCPKGRYRTFLDLQPAGGEVFLLARVLIQEGDGTARDCCSTATRGRKACFQYVEWPWHAAALTQRGPAAHGPAPYEPLLLRRHQGVVRRLGRPLRNRAAGGSGARSPGPAVPDKAVSWPLPLATLAYRGPRR